MKRLWYWLFRRNKKAYQPWKFEVQRGNLVEVRDRDGQQWVKAKFYRCAVYNDGSVCYWVYPLYQKSPYTPGGSLIPFCQLRRYQNPKKK